MAKPKKDPERELLDRYIYNAVVRAFSEYQSQPRFQGWPDGKMKISYTAAKKALQYTISKLKTLGIKF